MSGDAAVPEWPTTEPDAATLMRYFVGRGQFCLGLMTACERDVFAGKDSPLHHLYMSAISQMQHACDVVMLLDAAEDADQMASRIWLMAEAGDCYGEMLWEKATAAGLDPEAIHAGGVASVKRREAEAT